MPEGANGLEVCKLNCVRIPVYCVQGQDLSRAQVAKLTILEANGPS